MVKICGITNREDALAAIDGGASALGFNFYPRSPRYLSPDRAAELIPQLPAAVWKVGVFVDESPDHINSFARQIGLDVVQLYAEVGQANPLPSLRIWQAVKVDERFHLSGLDRYPAEAILLDTPSSGAHGGSGRTFDWSKAAGPTKVKLILAGGLDASNVRRAIATVHPWG